MRQRVHLATAPDGIRLAWAKAGNGPLLVKPANWLTHLQYDWESPVWRHWMEFLSEHFTFIRYDDRGSGMSDRETTDVSQAHWLPDLECVIDAAGIDRPMTLLGISQGSATAVRYAVAHPERVSRMILYGGYEKGWALRGGGQEEHYRAVLEMMRLGWGSDNPVFRQTFTARFVPEATHEQLDWFNELCRKTATPEVAVALLQARANVDITELLPRVRVPTLVIHARRDEVVPFSSGRQLASNIPGAEFLELDSRNHVLLSHEPAWRQFRQAVLDFCGISSATESLPDLQSLTRRESEIFELLASGLSNADIAGRLFISEKTVRNHLCSVYRKLQVDSRARAIVMANRLARSH